MFFFLPFVRIDIVEAHKNQQLCSLTGVEGGHSLGGSLSVLRTFYSLGVRYMTLTSTCHTPWADSSYADAPKYDVKHGGLTEFGKVRFWSHIVLCEGICDFYFSPFIDNHPRDEPTGHDC